MLQTITAFASQSRCWEYWSVYQINPPSAGLEAGRRVEEALERNAPEICLHTI